MGPKSPSVVRSIVCTGSWDLSVRRCLGHSSVWFVGPKSPSAKKSWSRQQVIGGPELIQRIKDSNTKVHSKSSLFLLITRDFRRRVYGTHTGTVQGSGLPLTE